MNTSKENEFMHELAGALGCPGEIERARRILHTVLHTLRDHLTLQESLRFLTQLPIFIQTVYQEGWLTRGKNETIDLDDFLQEIWENDGFVAEDDFENTEETIRTVMVVFMILGKYVPEGKTNEMEAILPLELKPLMTESFAA
jgi:uncharacterized protein (DUF2267 family)